MAFSRACLSIYAATYRLFSFGFLLKLRFLYRKCCSIQHPFYPVQFGIRPVLLYLCVKQYHVCLYKGASSDFVPKNAVKMSVFRIFLQRFLTVLIRLYHRTNVKCCQFLSIFSLGRPINCPVYRLYLCSYRIERFCLIKLSVIGKFTMDPVGSYFTIFIDLNTSFLNQLP